jgi:hypothetical protein
MSKYDNNYNKPDKDIYAFDDSTLNHEKNTHKSEKEKVSSGLATIAIVLGFGFVALIILLFTSIFKEQEPDILMPDVNIELPDNPQPPSVNPPNIDLPEIVIPEVNPPEPQIETPIVEEPEELEEPDIEVETPEPEADLDTPDFSDLEEPIEDPNLETETTN